MTGRPHRQVDGVRRQERVVLVGERLVVGEFRDQPVPRSEGRRERGVPQDVLLDRPRLHGHRAGVRVVGVALTPVLRDLGLALGPVVVGAVALSNAGSAFTANRSGADLPDGRTAAARAVATAFPVCGVAAAVAAVLTAVGMIGVHSHRCAGDEDSAALPSGATAAPSRPSSG
ncbi:MULTISPECIES: hypothetical protein [Streptomyces]|uniref:Uncharacterized protein n=1 Tax=Streptomyces lienomycini TaxID=284035 RepID=A0ABV9X649_9ACTN|nr:hypothetical protein [Streptomyces lienomycini]